VNLCNAYKQIIPNTSAANRYSREANSTSSLNPYRMLMDDRNNLQIASGAYRYGFNGKELDKPGMGGGQSTYDYGFRIYNPAIAKFLSVDPMTGFDPSNSSYSFAGNSPIMYLDGMGLFKIVNSASAAKQSQYPHLQLAEQRLIAISHNLHYLLRMTTTMPSSQGDKTVRLRDYIYKTAGLDNNEITSLITLGQGPTIEIVDDCFFPGPARTSSEEKIQIDADALQALGRNDLSESDLASLVLYWGVTLLHELCHVGDKMTNGGQSTGETFEDYRSPDGIQDFKRAGGMSEHRGADMTLAFFGNTMPNSIEDHTYTNPLTNVTRTVSAGMDLSLQIERNKRSTGLSDQEINQNAIPSTTPSRRVPAPNF